MTTSADVLRMIEDGGKLPAIADLTGLPKGEIVRIARENGYGLNVSNERFQRVAQPKLAQGGIVRAVPTVEEPAAQTLPVRPAQRDLIAEGKASTVARVRKAAVRAENALQSLADLLDETRATEAARAEIAELEQKLRDAKAALKGTATPKPERATAPDRPKGAKPPIGVDYRALDAWCQETGREWRKTKGRPSNALIAEFRAATEDGAA